MPKVLVLYYSAYGHIEAMAMAIAEGVRSAGAAVDIKRVPETAPEEVARAGPLQARPGGSRRPYRRSHRIRRNHRWHRDTLWPHFLSDGKLPRSSGRSLYAWGAQWKGWRCLHFVGDPAWRAGNHPVLANHQPPALRDGHRGPALQLPGPNETRRDHRRKPLRSLHHRRRRWFTPAERE